MARHVKVWACGAVAYAALLATGAPALGGADGERPRSVAVLAQGEKVRASQGSWCWSGPRTAICADYGYPLRVRRSIPVEPGRRVTFQFHDPAIESVSASLLHVRRNRIRERGELEDIERVEGNPRAWRATIPKDATRANRIDIFVRYTENRGDSNWWAGVRLGG
jgi:hypothetical protein